MLSILFIVFILVVAIQIGYYGFLFTHFSFAKKQNTRTQKNSVSVIISCKNEAVSISKTITHLLAQNHPVFEIIVVDDASTDKTLTILKELAKQHKKIKILSIPKTAKYSGNKKNALTLAIQKATYENLLFTDADCIPNSKNWITGMSAHFSDKKQLVLGYGAYQKTASWLNKLIRYETILTAWQYFSYAKIGLPYMGVGRNIAYTKTLFNSGKGFESHRHIQSGDDDLFVNQISTKQNTRICWQQETHSLSKPKENLTEWLHQKRRHITTANTYKPIHQLLLGLFYLSQILFVTLAIFLLLASFNSKSILVLIGVRYLFFFISFIPASTKLNEKDLIFWSPVLELFLIVLQLCIFITNLLGKPKRW